MERKQGITLLILEEFVRNSSSFTSASLCVADHRPFQHDKENGKLKPQDMR